MRIAGFNATPVAVPFREDEVWAYGGRRGLVSILLEVTTDEGLSGVGEAAAYPSTDIVMAVLRSIEPLVLGEDPFAIERIMKRINVVGTWHHVKATNPGIAAVEMACWDIVGKACGQPLVNLFGGRVRDEVEFFYYVSQKSPEEVAADGRRGAEQGFRTFYLKVGSDDPRDDIERVAALRDGAGPDAGIRIDANEAWSSATAIRSVAEMERYGLELVEQPVSGRNLAEMAYVRSRLSTPLLANEASWTRYDQLKVIRHGAADVLSVDNQMDGGLLEPEARSRDVRGGRAPRAQAQSRGAGPRRLRGGPCHGVDAELHLRQSVVRVTARRRRRAGRPPALRRGALRVPEEPGIGVELDDERVEQYAELYENEGEEFGFRDAAALRATPLLPKR